MPPPQYVVPPCDDVGMGSGAGSNLNNTLDDRMLDKDDLNALLYIVVTLLFYSMGIIIGIITYLKREKREIEEDKRFTDYMSMKMDPFSAFKVQNVRQVAERLKRLEEEKKAREMEEAAANNDIKSVEGDDAVFGDNEDNNEEDDFDDNDTPTTPLNASVSHRDSSCARKGSHSNASTRVHLGSLIGGSEKSSGARLSSVDSDSVKMSSAKSSLSDNNFMRTDSDICFVAAELQDVAVAEAAERRSNGVDSTCDSEDRQTVKTDTAERESIKTTDSLKDDIGDQCKDNGEGSSKDKSDRSRDKGAVPKDDAALSRGSSDDKLKERGEKAEDRGWLGRNVRSRDTWTPPRSGGTPPRSSATPPRGSGTPPMPLAVIRVGDSERRGGLPISPKALHLFDFQSAPRSGRSAHGRQLVKQGTMPEARHGLPRRVLRKQFSVSDTRRAPVLQLQGSLGAQARPWLGSGDSEDLQSPDTFDVSRV